MFWQLDASTFCILDPSTLQRFMCLHFIKDTVVEHAMEAEGTVGIAAMNFPMPYMPTMFLNNIEVQLNRSDPGRILQKVEAHTCII
jgi:hypothetical protein